MSQSTVKSASKLVQPNSLIGRSDINRNGKRQSKRAPLNPTSSQDGCAHALMSDMRSFILLGGRGVGRQNSLK